MYDWHLTEGEEGQSRNVQKTQGIIHQYTKLHTEQHYHQHTYHCYSNTVSLTLSPLTPPPTHPTPPPALYVHTLPHNHTPDRREWA